MPEPDYDNFVKNAGSVAALLKALANQKRLMVLCKLAELGSASSGALSTAVGLSQSALSQHLALLREEGILATRRQSQTIFYRIADPAAVKVIATLASIFCPPTAGETA